MSENKGNSFIKGAAILTIAGLIAKVMGFVYRIIIARILDADGIALYSLAYPVYTTLLVVSRSGIPVSLAKLISDRIARDERKNAFKIFRVGRKLSVIVGLFFSILMAVLARPIVNFLGWNKDAFYPVIAISPAIFIVSIMATYRGFFQGLQDMKPTAYSQIIEQFVRMLTMIGLVYYLTLYDYGKGLAAAGATFGAVTGSIAGLLTLLFIYYKKRKEIWGFVRTGVVENINSWKVSKEIAQIGIPVTIAALVQPLMNLVDATIVPNRLQAAGFSIEQADVFFGQLQGFAMVLVNFPTIITISLAASLVPSISEAFALKKDELIRRRTQTALRLAILLGLPASIGLYLLAEPLTTVIFDSAGAAIPLRIVSWGVFFIALQQISSAVLHGSGRNRIPAWNLLVGAITNGILNYFLTAQPDIGIRGASFGTVTGFAVAAILNLVFVHRFTHFKFKFVDLLLKPLIAVSIMGVIVHQGFILLNRYLSFITEYHYQMATFSIVLIATITYFMLLLLLNEIKYSDIILLPAGDKLARVLKRIGLVRD
ncbi:MAG: polysaccharide biosynthesis C-terminal domain-containing protein [Halanaerobiales bacterium]